MDEDLTEKKKARDANIASFVIAMAAVSLVHNTIGWGATGLESVLTYAAVVLAAFGAIGFVRSLYR